MFNLSSAIIDRYWREKERINSAHVYIFKQNKIQQKKCFFVFSKKKVKKEEEEEVKH